MSPPIEKLRERTLGEIKMAVVIWKPEMHAVLYNEEVPDVYIVTGNIHAGGAGRYDYAYCPGSMEDVIAFCRKIREQWPDIPIYTQDVLGKDPFVLWTG